MEAAFERWGSGFESACAGKASYPSESAADAAMKFMQDMGWLRTGDGLVPYECRFCREWHLGHQTHQRPQDGSRGTRVAK